MGKLLDKIDEKLCAEGWTGFQFVDTEKTLRAAIEVFQEALDERDDTIDRLRSRLEDLERFR